MERAPSPQEPEFPRPTPQPTEVHAQQMSLASEVSQNHIEQHALSAEVAHLNTIADIAVYGSGDRTIHSPNGAIIASPEKPAKGIIEYMNEVETGTGDAYRGDYEDLLWQGLPSSQAYLMMNLKEMDQNKDQLVPDQAQTKRFGKIRGKLSRGESAPPENDYAIAFTPDEMSPGERLDFIRNNGIYTLDEYVRVRDHGEDLNQVEPALNPGGPYPDADTMPLEPQAPDIPEVNDHQLSLDDEMILREHMANFEGALDEFGAAITTSTDRAGQVAKLAPHFVDAEQGQGNPDVVQAEMMNRLLAVIQSKYPKPQVRIGRDSPERIDALVERYKDNRAAFAQLIMGGVEGAISNVRASRGTAEVHARIEDTLANPAPGDTRTLADRAVHEVVPQIVEAHLAGDATKTNRLVTGLDRFVKSRGGDQAKTLKAIKTEVTRQIREAKEDDFIEDPNEIRTRSEIPAGRDGHRALELLSYGDVLDVQQAEQIRHDVESSPKGPKYATTLVEISKKHGWDTIEQRADELRQACLYELQRLGINPSVSANSISWAAWDLAKQAYLVEHPKESSEEYELGDPFGADTTAAARALQAILSRKIGQEHVQAGGAIPPEFVRKSDGQLRSVDYERLGRQLRLS